MTEVVRPADGDPVALRPCPAWCTERRHFAGDMVIHADDGYHHYGTEAEVATSRPFADMAVGGDPVIVRVFLTSWTHPLGADPGPALIELNLGTAADRTDMCAEMTPDEAEAVARALLRLAAAARCEGPASGGTAGAGGR
jgi:hypothetical protein